QRPQDHLGRYPQGPGSRRCHRLSRDTEIVSVPPHELDDFITLALSLADAAGEAIRPYFRQPLTVDDKADLTPVTIADRAAEQAMRSLIERRFPEHCIIGEDLRRAPEHAERVWTLHPIAGATARRGGVPLLGTA